MEPTRSGLRQILQRRFGFRGRFIVPPPSG